MWWFFDVIKSYPELAFFLTLALGYAVGKIQIGSFKVGTVPGVLVTGVIVGQLGVSVDNTVKTIFFLLFLFALGYNAGPQFFKGLKKEGLMQILFTVTLGVIALITTTLVGKVMGFNAGQAGGLASGALTQSSIIGVSQDAISKLDVNNQQQMLDFVPIGYAVTYVFGTLGCAAILSIVGPKIFKVDLEEACKELEQQDDSIVNNNSTMIFRTYRVGKHENLSISQIEKKLQGQVIKVRREHQMLNLQKDLLVQLDDEVVLMFQLEDGILINGEWLGEEVISNDAAFYDRVEVVLSNKAYVGKKLADIINDSMTVCQLTRNGESLNLNSEIVLARHDILVLAGDKEEIDTLIYQVGKKVQVTDESDMTFVGLGILLGGLIGIPSLMIGKIGITLSTSGGVLIMGLIFGYLHSRRPTIGQIPPAALWFLSNVGLAAFVAVVGINAGPGFVEGLKSSGISFFLAGLIVTTISTCSGILLAKYVFKFSAPIALGATAGALTSTPALGGLCEKAKSNAPVIGYTIPYTVANIILTIWGSLIVMLFS